MAMGRTVHQGSSNVEFPSNALTIFQFNTKIAHRAVGFGVTKEQSHGAKVARERYLNGDSYSFRGLGRWPIISIVFSRKTSAGVQTGQNTRFGRPIK